MTLKAIVYDALGRSTTITRSASVLSNRPPVAVPALYGRYYYHAIAEGSAEVVQLDGSDSYEPDGDPLSYVWRWAPDQSATGVAPSVSFAIGEYLIELTVTDDKGASSVATATVQVFDGTPPTIATPEPLFVEATGPLTPVTLIAPAVSDNSGVIASLENDAPVPALFPLGVTAVTWTVRDGAGIRSLATQMVTVTDSTAPAWRPLESVTLEATGTEGARHSFTPVATDLVDPAPALSCSSPSGGYFPLGVTRVACTARDASGNQSEIAFQVSVLDRTAPTLTLPPNIKVLLNSSSGDAPLAAFLAQALATDLVDGSVAVSHSSIDCSTVGVKTVRFSATDRAGNSASGTATITVVYKNILREYDKTTLINYHTELGIISD